MSGNNESVSAEKSRRKYGLWYWIEHQYQWLLAHRPVLTAFVGSERRSSELPDK